MQQFPPGIQEQESGLPVLLRFTLHQAARLFQFEGIGKLPGGHQLPDGSLHPVLSYLQPPDDLFDDLIRGHAPVFDEVQNLRDCAPQLKSLVDHAATTVLVTATSALRIEAGRDSLAGRITSI